VSLSNIVSRDGQNERLATLAARRRIAANIAKLPELLWRVQNS
jgi:hypothetical protein